jgi:hypothetical protein
MPKFKKSDKLHTEAKLIKIVYSKPELRQQKAAELGYTIDTELSNDEAMVFHKEGAQPIIAYRGIRKFKLDDWTDGLQAMAGKTDHDRFKRARSMYDAARNKYGEGLKVTGHSLGGAVAVHLGKETGAESTAFNPAGLPIPFTQKAPRNVKVVRQALDPVSMGYGDSPFTIGGGVIGALVGAVTQHEIDSFIE